MMLFFLLLFSQPALAMDVVCTLPWLADITHFLAPDAEITSLVRPNEDPHYLTPTPALMTKMGQADLYIENGLTLELWSRRLLSGAGNPSIRPGQKGHVVASLNVPRLGVPTTISRAQGDLHAQGNPHIWLDPLNAPIAADNIAAGLARVDPENADAYHKRAADFRAKIYRASFGDDLVDFMGGELLERLARSDKLIAFLTAKKLDDRLHGWLAKTALRGKPIVFYHQSWLYFTHRFGMKTVGYIEDRPGIAPSAAHKDELVAQMTASHTKTIGLSVFYDDRIANALARSTGAAVTRVPADVGATPEANDYFALIDAIIAKLGG